MVCSPAEPDEVLQVEEVQLGAELLSDYGVTHRVVHSAATSLQRLSQQL